MALICGKVGEEAARTFHSSVHRCEEVAVTTNLSSHRESEELGMLLTSIFPTHILIDIFLRLPIESLYSCRCVCKSWYTLISDPQSNILPFTAEPLHLMMLAPDNQHQSPDLMPPLFRGPTTLWPLHFVESQRHHNTFNLISLEFDQPDLQLANSCNGLICLYSPVSSGDMFVIVCNPVTGDYATVKSTDEYPSWCSVKYELGYSPVAKQYKILKMRFLQRDHPLDGINYRTDSMYTLGKEDQGTWKNIGTRRFDVSLISPSTYLGNTVHWIGVEDEGSSIISFNYESEQFGTVMPPPHLVKEDWRCRNYSITMGVLRGCLCVTHFTAAAPPDFLEIWRLNEYGVAESWTKDAIIEIPPPLASRQIRSLQYLENGELLLLYGTNCLLKYNADSKALRRIEIFGEGTYRQTLCYYCPSFVSLKDIVNAAQVQDLKLKSRKRRVLLASEDELEAAMKTTDDDGN